MSDEKKIISYRVVSKVVTSSIDDARRHRQWRKVIDLCYKDRIEHIEYRVLLALRHVGAITSYEIPYRLLLTRTPQAIDIIRSTGKSVYSVKYFVNCSESHISKRHLIAIYGFYKDEVHSLLDKILAQKNRTKLSQDMWSFAAKTKARMTPHPFFIGCVQKLREKRIQK